MYIEWVWIVNLGGKWECNPTQLNDGRNTILIEWALRLFSEYAKYVNFVAHIQWWRATILTRTTTTTAYHINIAVEWTLPQLYATNRKFGHRQRYFSNIKFEYSWICFYFICRYSALKTASLIFVYSRHDFLSSAESKELFFLLCCANKFKSNILCVNRHSLLMFDILDEWRKRTPWAPHRWNWKWNGIKWNEKKIFPFDHKHEHRTSHKNTLPTWPTKGRVVVEAQRDRNSHDVVTSDRWKGTCHDARRDDSGWTQRDDHIGRGSTVGREEKTVRINCNGVNHTHTR